MLTIYDRELSNLVRALTFLGILTGYLVLLFAAARRIGQVVVWDDVWSAVPSFVKSVLPTLLALGSAVVIVGVLALISAMFR